MLSVRIRSTALKSTAAPDDRRFFLHRARPFAMRNPDDLLDRTPNSMQRWFPPTRNPSDLIESRFLLIDSRYFLK
jgi:hypothetical protein